MIIAVIPAKGESTRLPNKNMQFINGKPMIYYSLHIAKECELIDRVYVSTDSDEIAEYAKKEGVEVISRGPELGGETPVVDTYIDVLRKINNPEIEVVVAMQPDHPDRKVLLKDAIKYYLEHNYDEIITVDGKGMRNGSLIIVSVEKLLSGNVRPVGTLMDDCTNVHTLDDLKRSESNLKKKETDL